MSAIFEMTLPSETLTADEVSQLSGCVRKGDQIEWLSTNGWIFHRNKAGDPVVGRLYARMKMAGINMSSVFAGSWAPDFSKVK